MDQLLEKVVHRVTSTAIGLYIFEADGIRYYSVLLKKTRDGDLQVLAHAEFDEINLLKDWIGKNGGNAPVIAGLDGKQVLLKKMEGSMKKGPEEVVKQLVPGADPGQLLINAYAFQNSTLVSLVRSEKYEEYLRPLVDAGINVQSCYVGPGVTLRFYKTLKSQNPNLSSFGFHLVQEEPDGALTVQKTTPVDKQVISDSLSITHHFLPAYCLATSFFAGEDPSLLNQQSVAFKNLAVEYLHKRIFKPYFFGAAVVLLVLFMCNVYFYLESSQKNRILQERSASTRLLVDQYNSIRKRYDEKQAIVDQLNYNNIESAWISDQIAGLLPRDVSLESLRINPLSKSRKDANPFITESIVLIGISDTGQSFGQFVSALTDLEFVEEVAYQHYKFNQSLKKGEFEVKLTYKTD
ncbi:MAG: hypothetical protein AAFO69_06890 [Bacteroidota bacterium]